MLVEERGNLTERSNDALESRRDVGEVGDAATDEQDFAFGMVGRAYHQVEHRSRVVVSLGLGRGARVLAVVGELRGEARRGDGVGIHDRGATTSDECPDASIFVEDGELERGAGLGIHLGNVCLFLCKLTAEWRGKLHGWTSIDCDLGIL